MIFWLLTPNKSRKRLKIADWGVIGSFRLTFVVRCGLVATNYHKMDDILQKIDIFEVQNPKKTPKNSQLGA